MNIEDNRSSIFYHGGNNMNIVSSNKKKFPTPFHAYQHYNVRDLSSILADAERGTLPTDTGMPFDVNFPIDSGLNESNMAPMGELFESNPLGIYMRGDGK